MTPFARGTYIESMDEPVDGTQKIESPEVPLGPAAPERTLRRSSTQRIFGGVAGGLAERFEVNANVVRVVFVVLSVAYGLGIAIYLAMWALIPRSNVEPVGDAGELEDPARVKWLRYAIPLGVVVLALILLATLRNLPALGATVWVVWLVFLVVMAVVALFAPAHRLTFRRLIALAFLSGVSFLILITGVFLITIHEIGVPLAGGSGEKQWAPTTLAEVQRDYRGAIGVSKIDLARVPFAGTTYITATQGVGVLEIYVPAGLKVDLKTHAGLGDVLDERTYFMGEQPVAQARGATLVLNAQVGIGQIQIQRVLPTPS